MADKILSSPRLHDVVSYDAATGAMTWAESAGSKVAGASVGRLLKAGYLRTRIDGQDHYVHRLAWLYFYGKWPRNLIDHIDGDKTNNRIGNLRDVTGVVNQQNRRRARSDSTSGLIGAKKTKDHWTASIRIDGKDYFLGRHDTPEKASEAYLAAKRRNHLGNML